MKNKIAILLLCCFASLPVILAMQVVYYQCNIDYIVAKYCVNKAKPQLQCNGSCHLAKELQKISISDPTDAPKTKISLLSQAFFPVYFQKTDSWCFTITTTEASKRYWQYICFFPQNWIQKHAPPPKISFFI